MLLLRRVDAVMENSLVFEAVCKKLGIPMNKFKTVQFKNQPLGVYFGKIFLKEYPNFLEEFNKYTAACALK